MGLSLSHVLRGHPKAAAPHPLYSLMLEETFRPTESLRGKKRLAVPLILFTHYGRMEKQEQSNFPYLKAPQASWSARGSIPDLAPFPKGSAARVQGRSMVLGDQGTRPPGRAGGLRPQLMTGMFCKEKRAHRYQPGDARGFTGNTRTSTQSTEAGRVGGRKLPPWWTVGNSRVSGGHPVSLTGPTCNSRCHLPPPLQEYLSLK